MRFPYPAIMVGYYCHQIFTYQMLLKAKKIFILLFVWIFVLKQLMLSAFLRGCDMGFEPETSRLRAKIQTILQPNAALRHSGYFYSFSLD